MMFSKLTPFYQISKSARTTKTFSHVNLFQHHERFLFQKTKSPKTSNKNSKSFTPFKSSYSNSLLIFLGIGAIATAYVAYNLDEVPISGRKRLLTVSRKTEVYHSAKALSNISTMYCDDLLPSNHECNQQVTKVGMRLIESSGLSNLSQIPWDFQVIQSNQAGAMALPNGKVFVFSGILDMVQNEDQLAAVLSHEIAHVLARHGAEHWSYVRTLSILEFWSRKLRFDNLANKIVKYSISIPFSIYCESEADHIGLLLMAKACYNPQKCLDFWRLMNERDPNSSSQYSSTHPSHQQRIDQIEEKMPQALMELQRSKCTQYMNLLNDWKKKEQTLEKNNADVVKFMLNIVDM